MQGSSRGALAAATETLDAALRSGADGSASPTSSNVGVPSVAPIFTSGCGAALRNGDGSEKSVAAVRSETEGGSAGCGLAGFVCGRCSPIGFVCARFVCARFACVGFARPGGSGLRDAIGVHVLRPTLEIKAALLGVATGPPLCECVITGGR